MSIKNAPNGFSFSGLPIDLQNKIIIAFLAADESGGLESLHRILVMRLIFKPINAEIWKEKACTMAYQRLMQKRKLDRGCVNILPVPAVIFGIVPPVSTPSESIVDCMMDQQDTLLLFQYKAMSKNNATAALEGLKMLVKLQRAMNTQDAAD